MKPERLVILGSGGNCIDILEAVNDVNRSVGMPRYQCVGFLDDDASKWGQRFHGVEVLGPLSRAGDFSECFFVNGIGSPSNYWAKHDIIARARIPEQRFATIVHPTASVSSSAKLGQGTVVFQHVTICNNVSVGNHVVILPNSVVSHDSVVGDFACVAGSVCVSGAVKIGRNVYLGAGSVLMNGISIGDFSLVGMGAVVLSNVEDRSVVVGNPARMLRRVDVPDAGRSKL